MVKEEKIYTTSDGKTYKTKKSAERYENALTLKRAGYDKSEVDNLIKDVAESNKMVRIFLNNKSDWRDWASNLVNQLPSILDDHKNDVVRYQIIDKRYFGNNEDVIKRVKLPRLKEGELPQEFENYIEELTNKDKDKNGSIFKLELYKEEDKLVKYVVKEEPLTPEYKLSKGIKLNEDDLSELVFEREEVYEKEGEDSRWSRTIVSVIKSDDGELYAIEWEKGLTENQEHYFGNQPERVKIEEREVVTTVTEIVYL